MGALLSSSGEDGSEGQHPLTLGDFMPRDREKIEDAFPGDANREGKPKIPTAANMFPESDNNRANVGRLVPGSNRKEERGAR